MSADRLLELRARKEELLSRAYWMNSKQNKPRFHNREDWLEYKRITEEIERLTGRRPRSLTG